MRELAFSFIPVFCAEDRLGDNPESFIAKAAEKKRKPATYDALASLLAVARGGGDAKPPAAARRNRAQVLEGPQVARQAQPPAPRRTAPAPSRIPTASETEGSAKAPAKQQTAGSKRSRDDASADAEAAAPASQLADRLDSKQKTFLRKQLVAGRISAAEHTDQVVKLMAVTPASQLGGGCCGRAGDLAERFAGSRTDHLCRAHRPSC